ncbi:trypsin-like peptidase domain-containing protein [Streptomyces sp. NPDC059134]|uniref:nSTAND1 domain-containing NTPase n=1 Tax=Streptomyces sp. NPDC059134 TaxID=3346738 RepID=UPI0036CDF31D
MTIGREAARTGAANGLSTAVAQVRDGAGLVVGAGFLVADGLVVTCAHVLADGGYGPGAMATLVFPHAPGAPVVTGRVLDEAWRAPHEQDVALVRLERPMGVAPLPLGSAAGARGHRVRSFGFPAQAPPGGHFGFAQACGLLPPADSAGELLQLTDANDLTQGFSGGPVLDEVTGLVVGMLTAITAPDGHDRGLGIAYATPTAVLREVRPALGELDVSPYRALEPFTAEHARWFRGREDAVNRVLEGLAGGRRAVLLLGPSGAGKSSLVQAGILPALAEGRLPGSDRWRQVLTRPGPDLPVALTRAGLPENEDGDGDAAQAPDARTMLVVDQFEGLLAPSDSPEALKTLARITAAILSPAALSVVLVMRDDFYSRLSALAPDLLDSVLQAKGVLNVPATLSTTDLDSIVTGPAHDLDTTFDPGLAEQIIADVLALNPRPGSAHAAPVTVLPLLEVALTRLWERRLDHDGRLTHDAYRRIGAVTGALTEWCDAALRELTTEQRNIARRILTALVRPADPSLNIPAARQQLPLDDLRELAAEQTAPQALRASDEVLAVLSRHRIVTTDRIHDDDTRPQDAEGTAVAELVHDALIRDWDTLHQWTEQDLRFHDWLHRARQQHTRWQEHQDPQDLPTGTLLTEGTDWATRRRLPTDLDTFLTAGRHRQQAAARRSRRLNTILATALALALIAAGIALSQRQTAVTAQQAAVTAQHVAQSRQLAAQSTSLLDSDPELAALLAIGAYRTSHTTEAASSLTSAANRPLAQRLTGHTDNVDSVAFSPDGRTLATISYDQTVRLWNVDTGKTIRTFERNTDGAYLVVFSPDGRTLAIPTDKTVRLWNVDTGKTIRTFTGHTGIVNSVFFSPNGHTLATASWDGTARLWNTETGKTIRTFTGHTDAVFSAVFSPDGRTLATNSYDQTVRLWNVNTGKTIRTFGRNTGGASSVAFSPDGHTLATNTDSAVHLWNVNTGKTIRTFGRNSRGVSSVAFSPDGHTLATNTDSAVHLWDTDTGEPISTLTGHIDHVSSVAFSPDGHTLATASRDKTVRLWNAETGKAIRIFWGHTGAVSSVAFSPDGHTLATGSHDGTARLRDVETGKTISTLTGHIDHVSSVAFSPDGHTLATASDDGTARLWDVDTGKLVRTFTGHVNAVDSVVFSLNGQTLATAGLDGTARLWDVETGKTIRTFTGHTGGVRSVVFSPDGHSLATGSHDDTARLWDVETGKTIRTFTGHVGTVGSVAFSPDRHTLATASRDGTARLWDVETGKTIRTFTNHTGFLESVVFSPDGHTLASAAHDGTARLWDVETGKTIRTFTGHVNAVDSVAFSPDRHTLATASSDHTVRLWTYVALEAAINTICKAVSRDLTDEEKAQYFPDQKIGPVCPA